ncbi:hypothetical protein EGR_02551 [Echinococcus granulosus]|uniref:Uncharacterized protein n=1 Tax=Echinococcus granulosus TaxID=6210 RepID=W6UMI7_ECHGR|nr:hypothetical protein EGR_02551 [Echinococcus granulosus]EUB62755.1 hypothetical protein EGR_02551 [Echinococcus granulosus]
MREAFPSSLKQEYFQLPLAYLTGHQVSTIWKSITRSMMIFERNRSVYLLTGVILQRHSIITLAQKTVNNFSKNVKVLLSSIYLPKACCFHADLSGKFYCIYFQWSLYYRKLSSHSCITLMLNFHAWLKRKRQIFNNQDFEERTMTNMHALLTCYPKHVLSNVPDYLWKRLTEDPSRVPGRITWPQHNSLTSAELSRLNIWTIL